MYICMLQLYSTATVQEVVTSRRKGGCCFEIWRVSRGSDGEAKDAATGSACESSGNAAVVVEIVEMELWHPEL